MQIWMCGLRPVVWCSCYHCDPFEQRCLDIDFLSDNVGGTIEHVPACTPRFRLVWTSSAENHLKIQGALSYRKV